MGRFEYKESSSEEQEKETDHHKFRKIRVEKILEKEEEDVERESSGREDRVEEIKFGDQLHDDSINSFCDKLQAVCPRKLEALLAIQFLMISDVSEISKYVTGRHSAMQVLYDRKRSHYILVHLNAHRGVVEMYDSLQMFDKAGKVHILQESVDHMIRLFGHLFTEHIPCIIDREYELQQDNFSCGYRVIGALIDLARQRNPATQKYSRTRILEFMKMILAEPKPTWQMFETARIGWTKEYDGGYLMRVLIENPVYTTTTTSSESSSYESSGITRTSSTNSLASVASDSSESLKHSHDDPFSGFDLKKAPTGFSLNPFEEYENRISGRFFNKKPVAFYYPPPRSPPSPTTALESPIAPCQSESTIMGYIRSQFQNLMSGITRRRDTRVEVEEVGKTKVKEHED